MITDQSERIKNTMQVVRSNLQHWRLFQPKLSYEEPKGFMYRCNAFFGPLTSIGAHNLMGRISPDRLKVLRAGHFLDDALDELIPRLPN